MSTSAVTIDSIFTSGDVLLNNPVQWCVIFVGVMLFSAFIQYLLQWLDGYLVGKYTKQMLKTAQKEIAVIGGVAIVLMIATSVLPNNDKQPLYAGLFSWSTILIFLVAVLYMMEMAGLYVLCTADMAAWRRFEESRLDTEDPDTLVLRQRHYRLAYDRFSDELLLSYQITPRQCPFHEHIQVFHKRYLSQMANFSFRGWLFLAVVVLSNFLRAKLYAPYSMDEIVADSSVAFYNAMIFFGSTGGLVLVMFGVFALLLFRKMSLLVNKQLRRSTIGSEEVPLGNPLRSVEFLQAILLSLNYFLASFSLGIANSLQGGSWRIAVVSFVVIITVFLVVSLIPWALWALSIMTVLGSTKRHRAIIKKIAIEHDPDGDGKMVDSDDEDENEYLDLDEDEVDDDVLKKVRGAPKRKGRPVIKPAKPLFVDGGPKKPTDRPAWLDVDEVWDGKRVISAVSPMAAMLRDDEDDEGSLQGNPASPYVSATDHLFYANVDGEDFDMVAREVAPELASSPTAPRRSDAGDKESVTSGRERATSMTGRTSESGFNRRPMWLDPDEPDLDL